MPKTSLSVEIAASARTVFDVVHDYDLRLSWDAMLSKAELLGPEPAVGVKSLCVGTWKSGYLPFETEYVAFAPGEVAAVKLTNKPVFFERFAASIRHRDRGALASRITYTYSFQARPRWIAFFLEPILDWRLKREVQRRLAMLKSFVEKRVKGDGCMLDPDKDWPDVSPFSALRDVAPEELRAWVNASPRRAFSGDEEHLWIARQRQPSKFMGAINSPPEPETPGIWSVDVFTPGFWSCFLIHPGVEVLSVAWNDDGFDLTLRLPKDLSVELGLQSSTQHLHFPPNPFRVIDQGGNTPEEQRAALVKLLEAGGVTSSLLARLARDRAERERLEKEEFRTLDQQATLSYLQAADASGRYGVPEDSRALFDETLKRHGLENYAANLARLSLPAYRLETSDEIGSPGSTRIGGLPDLPAGVEWPQQDGLLYTFVAQVDLAALEQLPGGPLPREGLLSFFAGDLENASDPGGTVLYSQGPVHPVALPDGAEFLDDEEEPFEPRGVCWTPRLSLPPYGSQGFDVLDLSDDEQDRLYEASAELLGPAGDASFVGAHPRSPQEDVLGTLTFQRHGYVDPRYWARGRLSRKAEEGGQWSQRLEAHDWWTSHSGQVATELHDWICLLDLDSHSDCGMCWWDAGNLLFLISRDDLLAGRFEEVRITLITS